MQRAMFSAVVTLVMTILAISIHPTSGRAHQSGCHAAHSCTSDTDSYVCGDTGNYNYCPALAGTAYISANGATVGTTLTANVSWTAFGASTYQWLRSGIAIPGATGLSYLVTTEDIGQSITISGYASDGRGQVAATVSVPVMPTAELKLSLKASKIKAGMTLKFRGSAESLVAVAALPITVNLWKKQGRSWKLKRLVSVTTDDFGEFTLNQKTSKRAISSWKAQAACTGRAGVPATSSSAVVVTTRK